MNRTVMVKDIDSGSGDGNPDHLMVVEILYFRETMPTESNCGK